MARQRQKSLTEARPNPSPALLVSGAVLLSGVAAAAYWWFSSEEPTDESTPTASGGVVPVPGVPGVFMKSGVHLTPQILAFLPKIRAQAGFDLIVNSGLRTAAEQGQAVYNNYVGANSYGKTVNGTLYTDGHSYLRALYGSTTGEKLYQAAQQGPSGLARATEEILAGGGWQTGHLTGQGIDFNVHNLSPEQYQALKTAGRFLGASVTDEGDHIHMEKIAGAGAQVAQAAQTALPYMIAASSVAGVALIGGMWWFTHHKKTV